MTHIVRTQIRNGASVRRAFYLEPWGEDYGIDPDEVLEIIAKNVDENFCFQISFDEEIEVWAQGDVVDIGVYKDGSLINYGYKSSGLSLVDYPITPAIRFLREKKIEFVPHLYEYVEKGGTAESARQLDVDEQAVVKTLVFETNEKKPLIVLMHGSRQVSTKNLARHIGVKSVKPATPERASKLTGYLVGGTSPFGARTAMPIYVEKTIFDLDKIYINGGKRGFLVEIAPLILKDVLKIEEVSAGIEN